MCVFYSNKSCYIKQVFLKSLKNHCNFYQNHLTVSRNLRFNLAKKGQKSEVDQAPPRNGQTSKSQYFVIPCALWTPHYAKIGGSPGRPQGVKFRSINSYFLLVSSTSTFAEKTNEIINIFRNAQYPQYAGDGIDWVLHSIIVAPVKEIQRFLMCSRYC